MQWQAHQIDYRDTGYFSGLILDYLENHESLRAYYAYRPTYEGIRAAIDARKSVKINRQLLVEQLRLQYQDIQPCKEVASSIAQLLDENTFTITTAHQPNLLTGPLYFIYKIIHAIRLADDLNKEIPDHHFVPVYYMGMEDADFEELSHFTVKEKTYRWNTDQKGAFGRMVVDKALIQLINELEGQLGNLPHADAMISVLKSCFSEGKTIAQATFEWVHHLFGHYGLVVLLPDAPPLKSQLIPEMKDDLIHHTASQLLEKTRSSFPYPADWQANARPINLFYLQDQLRERIDNDRGQYKVLNTALTYTKDVMLDQLQTHPERFSPNVILRPLYQEKILPNLVYIGGAGELAYWLQLKDVFDHYQIPFPVLMLRYSLVLLSEKQKNRLDKLGFEVDKIFQSADRLINRIVERNTEHDLKLDEEKEQLQHLFQKIQENASVVDPTLKGHVAALLRGITKKLNALEQKMMRAEKRNFEDAIRQIHQMKNELFPNGTLQERKENMMVYYAQWGNEWLQQLYDSMQGSQQKMRILSYPSSY
jgi:bacillithiol biosynthesis cysteine-adding enzyme BshC